MTRKLERPYFLHFYKKSRSSSWQRGDEARGLWLGNHRDHWDDLLPAKSPEPQKGKATNGGDSTYLRASLAKSAKVG